MSYQSEAQLEQQLIEQLISQDYKLARIDDYDTLLDNFKIQFERFNESKLNGQSFSDKEWERIFNYISGKSIFQSAKILRDKFVLERDNGTKIYLSLLDEDFSKNIYQVTNQTTIIGKYKNRYDVTLLVNGLPLVQLTLKKQLIRSCVTADILIRGYIILFSSLWYPMEWIPSILLTVTRIFCIRIHFSGRMRIISASPI